MPRSFAEYRNRLRNYHIIDGHRYQQRLLNSPYRNNQSWTRHARCAANETMWYRFKFFCLETGYDYATVTFSNTSEASLCLTGNQQMQQWRRSNSELLTISFSSDGFVTSGGFELIVACRASGNNDWLDIIEEEDN